MQTPPASWQKVPREKWEDWCKPLPHTACQEAEIIEVFSGLTSGYALSTDLSDSQGVGGKVPIEPLSWQQTRERGSDKSVKLQFGKFALRKRA